MRKAQARLLHFASVPWKEAVMFAWALVFFIIALVAGLFGFFGLAASAALAAKVIFVVAIVMAIISFVVGRRRPAPN
jgi:uncharacterized membrane protein YtjA (UPF0391 family)